MDGDQADLAQLLSFAGPGADPLPGRINRRFFFALLNTKENLIMFKQLATRVGIEAIERGWMPDSVTRKLVRGHCTTRLRETRRENAELPEHGLAKFAEAMRQGPIARVPELANEQHYEVPSEFFRWMLGPKLKYSCCLFESPESSLADAEVAALRTTCERADIQDGMDVLELGCGWGSLTLWMLENFPQLKVSAVSNSASQRSFILQQAEKLGAADRLNIVTADMNEFQTEQSFDRIVSCEMFEHMFNYEQLLSRISSWLKRDGKLFIHIFCHTQFAYEFHSEGASNWMGKYFFSGGIMPSLDLLSRFDQDLAVCQQWTWEGTHYEKTCNAWLELLDQNKRQVLEILSANYGPREAKRWLQRWRLFLIACAELFGYEAGQQWMVGHFLLEPQPSGKNEETLAVAPEKNFV